WPSVPPRSSSWPPSSVRSHRRPDRLRTNPRPRSRLHPAETVKEDRVMTQPSSAKRPHAVAALLLALAAAAPARAQLDPLLPQAFFTAPCPNPGSAGSVVPGRDLWKIGVAPFFPDALCNDGTRAVFYVRRYADD